MTLGDFRALGESLGAQFAEARERKGKSGKDLP
jgi:hypothetical protein